MQAIEALDADNGVERYAWFAPVTKDFPWLGGCKQRGTAQQLEPAEQQGRRSSQGQVLLYDLVLCCAVLCEAGELHSPAGDSSGLLLRAHSMTKAF